MKPENVRVLYWLLSGVPLLALSGLGVYAWTLRAERDRGGLGSEGKELGRSVARELEERLDGFCGEIRSRWDAVEGESRFPEFLDRLRLETRFCEPFSIERGGKLAYPLWDDPPPEGTPDWFLETVDYRNAVHLESNGDRQAALAAYERILSETSDPPQRGLAELGKARCQRASGEPAHALRTLRDARSRYGESQGPGGALLGELILWEELRAAREVGEEELARSVSHLLEYLKQTRRLTLDRRRAWIPACIGLLSDDGRVRKADLDAVRREELRCGFLADLRAKARSDWFSPSAPAVRESLGDGVAARGWFSRRHGKLCGVIVSLPGFLKERCADIAVKAASVDWRLAAGEPEAPAAEEGGSPAAVEGFPGLFLVPTPALLQRRGRENRGQWALFFSALSLLVVSAGMGGFLSWRLAQREARLARQKTEWVAAVSHELKTPLTSIRMFSDLLRKGSASEKEKREHYADVISDEAVRLQHLIDNVLDFARLQEGRRAFQFELFEGREAARQAAELMRAEAGRRQVRMEIDAPEQDAWVRADRLALTQALVNLVSNAVKYSPEGSRVGIAVRRDGDGVAFEVADAGAGISPEDRERIFDRFYRSPEARARAGGVGLGLPIARSLVEAMGGTLTVDSRPGEGSRFRIRMPAVEGDHGNG